MKIENNQQQQSVHHSLLVTVFMSLNTVFKDIRFGFRILLKNPGYASVVILTLAVGIGANTTVFSFVNGVLFKPLPYNDIGRLFHIEQNIPEFGNISVSVPDYMDWVERNRSFEALSAYQFTEMNMSGQELPERINVGQATANFFQILGARTVLGRLFTAEEDQPSALRTAVLSYGFWKKKFGGNQDIIGRTIQLHENEYTVIGVVNPDFSFPPYGINEKDVWIPLGLLYKTNGFTNRGNHGGVFAIGKLKRDVTPQQAQSDLNEISNQLQKEYPDTNTSCSIRFQRLQDRMFQDIKPEVLYALMGAVGFVLLIVCANVMNIVLAKSISRSHEIAVRSALGASRSRIISQMLCESAVMVALGAGLGILFSEWGLDWLVNLFPERAQGVRSAIALDWNVLGYTALVSTLTVVLFGLAPAIQMSGIRIPNTIKEGGRNGNSNAHSNRLRNFLASSEVCMAMALLCGSGLMIHSFINLLTIDRGVDTRNTLAASIALPETRYTGGTQINAYYNDVLREVYALPGVRSAAVTSSYFGGPQITYYIEGGPIPEKGKTPSLELANVSPDYFETLKIRLKAGRLFTGDERSGEKRVAVIDETMAKRHWGEPEAIGKRFMLGDNIEPYYEVIGVVNHVKNHAAENESIPQIYLPMTQDAKNTSVLLVRTENSPMSLANSLREKIKQIDTSIPLYGICTVDDSLANRAGSQKMATTFMSFFAFAALILAAFGIYGVMIYSVSQRTKEIGIRMALGAQMSDVIRMVLGQGIKIVLKGMASGLILSFCIMRLMKSLLFQISTYDLTTLIFVTLILAGSALFAGFIPAWRASKTDPMKALRCE